MEEKQAQSRWNLSEKQLKKQRKSIIITLGCMFSVVGMSAYGLIYSIHDYQAERSNKLEAQCIQYVVATQKTSEEAQQYCSNWCHKVSIVDLISNYRLEDPKIIYKSIDKKCSESK